MGNDKKENKRQKKKLKGVPYDHLSEVDKVKLDEAWEDDPFKKYLRRKDANPKKD